MDGIVEEINKYMNLVAYKSIYCSYLYIRNWSYDVESCFGVPPFDIFTLLQSDNLQLTGGPEVQTCIILIDAINTRAEKKWQTK